MPNIIRKLVISLNLYLSSFSFLLIFLSSANFLVISRVTASSLLTAIYQFNSWFRISKSESILSKLNHLVFENKFGVLVGKSHQVSTCAGDGDGENKGWVQIHHMNSPEEPWNKGTDSSVLACPRMHRLCAHMHGYGTHKWESPKRWRHCRRTAPTTWSTHFGWSPAAAALPPLWKLQAPSWSTFSVVFSEKSGSLAAVRAGVQNRRREAIKELRAAELVRRGRGRAWLKGE